MPAQSGDTVRVHYTGTLDDGTEFDSSQGGEPIEFALGQGQVIPGFEEAVTGMEAGEQKTVTIPSEQAYGQHHSEMVLQVQRDQIPPDVDPEVGDELQLQTGEGRPVPVRVTDVGDGAVTLDANHPLAGQDLTFDIKLEAIV